MLNGGLYDRCGGELFAGVPGIGRIRGGGQVMRQSQFGLRRRSGAAIQVVATFALFMGVFLALAASAQAATITVTNLNDDGAGSLRQAILAANASVGADTITFSA